MGLSRFQVGDRVRVSATAVLRGGLVGTIVQSFQGQYDLYEVHFDDDRTPRLMLPGELDPADSPAPDLNPTANSRVPMRTAGWDSSGGESARR
jgi:hypothetical protein